MNAVEQVSNAPGGKLLALVPHGGGVAPLQTFPERHGPRVGATPAVHHAPGFRLRQQQAVDAAHRSERADAAREAAGKFLHLANLALIACHLGDRDVKGSGRVDLVDVLTTAEQIQLGVAPARQPRVDARLDGRPVGHHQSVAGLGQQRRAQHLLQHVSDALAVLGDDLAALHHRVAN